MRVVILGAGAGGTAAAVELCTGGHDTVLWSRSEHTLAPFEKAGGIRHDGVLGEGIARPAAMTSDLPTAIAGAEVALVVLPTYAHGALAQALATVGWPAEKPVILNPGHTGGALEFAHAFRSAGGATPAIAELSTLTYVARKYSAASVTISGRARRVRGAALPGGTSALQAARALYPSVVVASDVLATGFANVNMILHPPGSLLAAAWVEATGGAFTFYVEAMTPGVARTMRKLDLERRAVAAAFGHDLPSLIEEMKLIGTVEKTIGDTDDFRMAISGGEANRDIKAPGSLTHRYYREDFGHGLLPFIELATIAGVEVPVAQSLLTLAAAATDSDFRQGGRTAESMGVAGMSKDGLLSLVREG